VKKFFKEKHCSKEGWTLALIFKYLLIGGPRTHEVVIFKMYFGLILLQDLSSTGAERDVLWRQNIFVKKIFVNFSRGGWWFCSGRQARDF